jgi:hypothetical protein
MISGSTALQQSTTSLTGLTYINELITGATAQGKTFIIVEGPFMNSTMKNILMTTYGYTVTTRYDDMGSYPRYLIGWS